LKDIRGAAKREREFARRAAGRAIRAQLLGDICTALGITAKSDSPILRLCRKLVDAGHDPSTPLEAYRGDLLALRVKSIGQGAHLKVDVAPTGRPFFKRDKSRVIASPIRPNLEAAE
jgi:hypothetical protein